MHLVSVPCPPAPVPPVEDDGVQLLRELAAVMTRAH